MAQVENNRVRQSEKGGRLIDAITMHARLGADGWKRVLAECGVAESYLRNKHGPCPACGGKDRFRFDNKRGRGDHFCSQCGSGDGFNLIMKINRCDFQEAFDRVLASEGIDPDEERKNQRLPLRTVQPSEPEISKPTRRVRHLLNESCIVENCDPAIEYLYSRKLWPLPAGHRLRAHPSFEYWHDNRSVGRFPVLVAAVRDGNNELVTVHVTYLTQAGQKISEYEPRKILSPLTGRIGCAAQLMPHTDVLGIAEGIETALSAAKLTGIPTWATLNSALMAKFELPASIKKLVIFADRDVAGLEAATQVMQKLQDSVQLDVRIPRGKAKDWNDTLTESMS